MPGHCLSARINRLGTTSRAFRWRPRRAAALLFAAACGGCAAFSPDGGMTLVNSIVAPELKSEAVKVNREDLAGEVHARATRLLGATLSADGAVRIALLNNKGLQASYNDLGIAEAAMVEASLPPNPTFSLSRIQTPVELDIERRIIMDILALATLPARAELAAERFRQAQLRAALETLRVGFETRRVYYRAVAAEALAASLAQAVSAAESAAKLAKELGETGAMNKLDQAREEAFYAELSTRLAAARQRAASEREQVIRALGLQDGGALKLPHALPALPNAPRALVAVETEAIRRRVDLKIARIEVDTLAKTYGLTEPVEREFAPGMTVHLWGYNGQSPGPTIECVEGDKVRIFVTNKLPEHTSVHWHGMLVPSGMDGVGGLTQPHIEPGKTFVYEFQLKGSGTFMYHPHSDEMCRWPWA
jgi:hypothetical protein